MPLPFLATAGGQLLMTGASAAAQYGIQAGMAKGNSRRAYRQQEKYTDLQMGANKELARFQQELGYENLQKGYEYQKQGMKDAGLNPALMYGTSGGSGMTQTPVGSATGAQEHGETKIQGPDLGMGMMQASQLALIKAQKDNIEADTAVKHAEVANKGADTTLKQHQTTNIDANTGNTNADTQLKEIQQKIQNVQAEIAGKTIEEQIQIIDLTKQNLNEKWLNAVRNNDIGDKTFKTRINQINADLALTLAQASLAKSNIQLNNEQIEKVKQEVLTLSKRLSWIDIQSEDAHAEIQATIKKIGNDIQMNDLPDTWKEGYRVFESILGGASHGPKATSQSTQQHTHFHDAPKYK